MDLGDEQPKVAPGLEGDVPIAYPDPDTESAATRVYLAVLQHPQPSRSLLIAHGIREDLVDASLRILDAQGLIRLHEGGHLEVVPPDIALPNVAAELEHRARQTRSAAHELAQVYFQARANTIRPDPASLRVLQSMDELAAATADIISTGTERIRCFRSMSPRTRELFAAPLHSHEARSTGVGGVPLDMATTYTAEVLDLDNALQVLEARERGGERFRFVNSVPFSALVVDETAAVVDTTLFEENGAGSVLVRSRPMVRALAALADLFWDLGSPLPRTAGARTAEARDRAILALLAAGAPDATIARQTGVSQRTVERRVRALMDQLGAGTRFQAGVQAARRGLL
ncbi:LuxR C-terminal-related transcriptional regulator [Knoellia sp. p5-6-4]|uniref:LuxR C-terminal-related transcriptional regulator n=1 Tax=unclassified Knoellia TaxID=2618719 RepID=UPI0023DA1C65|nr:LuxR C-terminal-related transcriptional regulator [Knoellia sp. p5-6-4]MDF2145319.1 LuxR C-terminal-related transcriptional regulator [Knoellia sp. p5-6-4]